MSGLSESKQTHVHLRNVDPGTLQTIITYAYTGNLAINDSTVEPLYETACFLQVGTASPIDTHIIHPMGVQGILTCILVRIRFVANCEHLTAYIMCHLDGGVFQFHLHSPIPMFYFLVEVCVRVFLACILEGHCRQEEGNYFPPIQSCRISHSAVS